MATPVVEILYFDGCPNHDPALELVERIALELGVDIDLASWTYRRPTTRNA